LSPFTSSIIRLVGATPLSLVHHEYLAFDFFLGLSGFVVAYAYDDRWTKMSIRQSFRVRLIQTHPLVLVGATLGLLGSDN
jgi:hypothetical protein